ncbi:MAG TPA: sigma-54 dependent transcriptional regulator [Thermoanaerobaculia bacterium]|nr:sigma-54 dependent transcriptional regulator [Thermoanaerobaculia bacterium]
MPPSARKPSLRDAFRTRNAALRNVIDTVEKVLDHDASILILGESGVGKDTLAETIHACSNRRDEPFVHIECASIPPDLFESELFGHERGTFTDAHARKLGKLEAARRGTVYFDEISALSPQLQAKLLRAIEDRRFPRLGGGASVPFEARVISSTSGDPKALRRDLFYRINVVTLTLPPLRERPEDLLPLAKKFLGRKKLDANAGQLVASYSWPGNVRELKNAMERAALVADDGVVTAALLPVGDLVATAARGSWTLDQLESHYIREILTQTRGNNSRAAEILGINRKTLLEKRRKYGLD